LGTQLIRRNDELALLYEKIKIQQSTLNKGEIQYRERLEDIRVLKLEIKKIRREKALLQSETVNVDGLRQEIYRLQRELLRERTRVKVLEEELENPMNIHRWRKLEGSDPAAYEMIQKIQTLQKRLISKTEEVVEKELLIQSKEKLYLELKNILARQPGPEVAEQLNIYQQQMKDKSRQLKVRSKLEFHIRLWHQNSTCIKLK
jgi:predicted RNase H-like nuclease (RuvC/YqgF family)